MLQMAEKTEPDAPPNCAVVPEESACRRWRKRQSLTHRRIVRWCPRNLRAADGGKDRARRTAELCGVALSMIETTKAPAGATDPARNGDGIRRPLQGKVSKPAGALGMRLWGGELQQRLRKGFQTSERQRSEPSPGARLRFAGAMGRCSAERGFFGGGGFDHDDAPSVPRRPGHRRSVGRERLYGHGGAAVGSNDASLRGYDLPPPTRAGQSALPKACVLCSGAACDCACPSSRRRCGSTGRWRSWTR